VRVHRETCTLGDVVSFADLLITDRHLEAKALGVEALACYRRVFTTGLLATWKRWLATDRAANWATTDAICGLLIGPLVVANPRLVRDLSHWSRDRNLWASAVSLIPLVRKGLALDEAYALADGLHADREDLIQKAVGWMLREAGKADPDRLQRYLRANGPKIPRTTVCYAIERFSPADRRQLLMDTRRQSQPSPD
jgi:3-methyladenine DNA glycosylase AlkD